MTILTIANLLAWSAQIAIIVAAALLALRIVRLEAPGVRYVVLRAVLGVCLLLPLIQPRTAATLPLDERTGAAVESQQFQAQGAVQAGDGTPSPLMAFWTRALGIVLLAGVFARLAWIAAGVVRLRRLRRAGEVALAPADHEDLQSLIDARATIRHVRGLGQPITFGFRQPVVLLPESLQRKPAAIQRAVLAHELWHVRRRDWAWTVLEEAIRAAFWFHPALRLLVSRIQSTREEVVDELAILATGSRRSYVDALLAYADEPPLFAATAFARRRHLVHRMMLISREVVMSAKRVVACAGILAVVVASSGWYAVSAFPLTQAPESSSAMPDSPGPIEQKANPITPENPVPRRLRMVPADYPATAEAADATGWVSVQIVLDEVGRVAETRVVGLSARFGNGSAFNFWNRSTGFESFLDGFLRNASEEQRQSHRAASFAMIEAARRAVNQWVYAPPADGPLAFPVNVAIAPADAVPAGADAPPPPPPPPPPSTRGSARTGMPPPPPPAPGQTSGWEMSDGALRVGGAIKPPIKLRNVNPIYPPEAQAAKIQGVVIIEARIAADGTVTHARILKSIAGLDEAALDAVRQWEFTPTLMNGQAVPVLLTTTINFSLQ